MVSATSASDTVRPAPRRSSSTSFPDRRSSSIPKRTTLAAARRASSGSGGSVRLVRTTRAVGGRSHTISRTIAKLSSPSSRCRSSTRSVNGPDAWIERLEPGDHRRQRAPRPRQHLDELPVADADPVQREREVREQRDRVVVALVDAQPADGLRVDVGKELREERGLAVAGGRDDERDVGGRLRAEAGDEIGAWDRPLPHARRRELRLQERKRRLEGLERACSRDLHDSSTRTGHLGPARPRGDDPIPTARRGDRIIPSG